jgi:hypothetical protein
MPIPTVTVKESPVARGAQITPLDTLKQMVRDVHALIECAAKTPNINHKKAWFGSSADHPEVAAWTGKLFTYIDGGLNKLDFSCANTPGSIASCAMYTTDRVTGGKDVPNKLINMQLNNGFRSGLYSYGEKVGTIIHELTHKCIGTNDEQIALRDCYGALLCAVMARMRPDLAITNADNWGYYLTAYHTDLGWTGDDWNYLSEASMQGVGPRIV